MESNETPQGEPNQGTPEVQVPNEQEQRTNKTLGTVLRIAGQPDTPLERQRLAKAHSTAQDITSGLRGQRNQIKETYPNVQLKNKPVRQPESGSSSQPLDIDTLADRVSRASPEELPAAIMEFYRAKAAELKQLPETPENKLSREKYEQVAVKLAEQLGLLREPSDQQPKLEVSYSNIIKKPRTQ